MHGHLNVKHGGEWMYSSTYSYSRHSMKTRKG